LKFGSNIFKHSFYKQNDNKVSSEEKVYYAPEKGMNRTTEILGIAFRGIIVFCAIFGLIHLLYQSIGICRAEDDYRYYSMSAGFIALISFVFAVICSIAPINRITKAAVPVGTLGAVFGIAAATQGNPILLFENAVRYLYNCAIECVVSVGYTGMAEFVAPDGYSFSERAVAEWSVVLLALLLAILLYFSVTRKTNIVLFAVTIAPIVAAVFFFNIVQGNLGFAFVVASIAGFISMRIVDSRYGGMIEKRTERRKNKAQSKAEKREKRGNRKIEKLRLKTAADRIYETAIDAEMGAKRARLAKRSVIAGAKKSEKIAKKNEKARLKEEKKARRQAKKEEKKKRALEKSARRAAIKAERSLPENEKRAAKAERLAKEKEKKAAGKAAKAEARREAREKRLEKSRRTRRNRAAGGYAAAAAAVLALLAALIPFSISRNPFPKIEFVDSTMRQIRSFATDFLIGDGVDLTQNPYGKYENFNYETLSFAPREYKGTQIFRVEAPSKSTVYLKSRTALDYDISNDTWNFATSDDVLNMNREFGKKFTPDIITKNAYTYLYPISGEIPSRFTSINLSAYGFIVEQVHVKRANGASGILFIPSVMNPELGVRQYYSTDAANDKYTPFFDGIYTSRHYGVNTDGYSSISYVYDMTRTDLSEIIETEKTILELTYSLALRAEDGEDAKDLLSEYSDAMSDASFYNDLAVRYFEKMSRGERGDFREAAEQELKYRDYVNKTYTGKIENERIAELSKKIISEAEAQKGSALTRYETVMAVIKYLDSSEFTYSLTPNAQSMPEESVIEAFLFDVKCGYCAHFATAATLLLREAGIPVRYTEGYHVSDFQTIGGTGASDRYGSDARDKNSHTWIEVYFDTIGWIPFETTRTFTEYTEKAKGSSETGLEDDTEKDAQAVPETVKKPEKDNEEETKETAKSARVEPDLEIIWMEYKGYFIALAIIIVSIIAVRYIILLFKKSIDLQVRKRNNKIALAKDEAHYKNAKTDNRSEAKYLIDTLFRLFKELDIGPEKGEQLSEFAKRLTEEYGGLSSEDPNEVMRCVLKEEFGHGLTYGEMSCLASYLEDAMRSIYAGLTKTERLKYRYIKRII